VIAVWLACAGWFSAVAVVVNEHAGADFVTRSGDTSPLYGQYADFFAWHFAEQVPLLRMNETLHWKVPLTYQAERGGSCSRSVYSLVPLVKVALPAAQSAARRSFPTSSSARPATSRGRP